MEASDIHVEPSEENFAVRMRVDGVLHTRLTQPVERFPGGSLTHQADLRHRHRPNGACPRTGASPPRISGREMDIRVSTVPCAFGESVVAAPAAQGTRGPEAQEPGHGAGPPANVSHLADHQ